MPKISKESIFFMVLAVIMMLIHAGCRFPKGGGGGNNTMKATATYVAVKSEDAQITKERKKVFQELQKIIKNLAPGKVPVNYVFNSLLGLNKLQIVFVKKAVRRYVKPPELATDPKVVIVKDFQDIVQTVLHLYEYDELKNIDPTWRK